MATSKDDIRRDVLHEEPHRPPGEAVKYTDRTACLLRFLVDFHPASGPADGTRVNPTV
jgi:hypothetical protein